MANSINTQEQIIRNPITKHIKAALTTANDYIQIAVPFVSDFANTILSASSTSHVKKVELLIRFDERSISSFDLPTMELLIKKGYELRYLNKIHLKLYIIGNDIFISSSNLTQGGFEDNHELTVRIDTKNHDQCRQIFNDLWKQSSSNKITDKLIKQNWTKYEILKIKDNAQRKSDEDTRPKSKPLKNGLDLDELLNKIINEKTDYSHRHEAVKYAVKLRETKKTQLANGFDVNLFYAPQKHKSRNETLFYDFVYGYEKQLSGTGLRELQFRQAFLHPKFIEVMEFMYPPMIKMPAWNFNEPAILKGFCQKIFEFKIPSYSETLPIRLASYLYPEFFMPIFKLDPLQKLCEAWGLQDKPESKGDRLFAYTQFLFDKLKIVAEQNYIKSDIAYRMIYTFELHNRLQRGELFDDIRKSYSKVWQRNLINHGMILLNTR